jgi:hypothetical protein
LTVRVIPEVARRGILTSFTSEAVLSDIIFPRNIQRFFFGTSLMRKSFNVHTVFVIPALIAGVHPIVE